MLFCPYCRYSARVLASRTTANGERWRKMKCDAADCGVRYVTAQPVVGDVIVHSDIPLPRRGHYTFPRQPKKDT